MEGKRGCRKGHIHIYISRLLDPLRQSSASSGRSDDVAPAPVLGPIRHRRLPTALCRRVERGGRCTVCGGQRLHQDTSTLEENNSQRTFGAVEFIIVLPAIVI